MGAYDLLKGLRLSLSTNTHKQNVACIRSLFSVSRSCRLQILGVSLSDFLEIYPDLKTYGLRELS